MCSLDARLNIVQVSTIDIRGGAAKVAWNLFTGYRYRGHRSWLAVGYEESNERDVLLIPNDRYRTPWAKTWLRAAGSLQPLTDKIRGMCTFRASWAGSPSHSVG